MVADGLTRRQRRFVAEYLVDLNAAAAARRAGYAAGAHSKTPGSRAMQEPAVRAAIDAAMAARAARLQITPERVLHELAALAYSNIGEFLRGDADGRPVLQFSRVAADQLAGVRELVINVPAAQDDVPAWSRGAAPPTRCVRIRLADKRAALVALGRHLGIFDSRSRRGGDDGEEEILTVVVKHYDFSRAPGFETQSGSKPVHEAASPRLETAPVAPPSDDRPAPTRKTRPLTEAQARFAAAYAATLSGADAVRTAGFSPRHAASRAAALLRKPHVREAVDAALEARIGATAVAQELVMRELAAIAFTNIRDYLTVDDDGTVRPDMAALIRDAGAGLVSLTVGPARTDQPRRRAGAMRIRLFNKKAALEALGEHLGLFGNRRGRKAAKTTKIRTVVETVNAAELLAI